jgi:hypothetical protein
MVLVATGPLEDGGLAKGEPEERDAEADQDEESRPNQKTRSSLCRRLVVSDISLLLC